MDDRDVYESLVKWLKILDLSAPCGKKHLGESLFQFWELDNFSFFLSSASAMDLSSGVALGELLALIAPDYSPKIKNIGSGEFRSVAILTALLILFFKAITGD